MSIREALEQAVDQLENNTIEPVEEQPAEIPAEDIISEEAKVERDEQGKFKAKESNDNEGKPEETEVKAESEPTKADQEKIDAVMESPEVKRPTTWKKEYLSLWDKAYNGEALTKEEGRKLTAYLDQREAEYKKGVSTYKQEADRARALEEAINPFIPELQAQGIHPAAWINNLGRAHMILTKAPYKERVEMFHRLAGDYGIQFNQSGEVIQQNIDPYAQQLMDQLNQVNQEVGSIKSRFQQEEDAKLDAEIAKFSNDVENYPHFEALRNDMAQLLELGKAKDLKSAYELAERLNDEFYAQKQEQLLQEAKQEALKQAQIQKAKSAAVSVKTTTPSGVTSDGVDKKDRRAVLDSVFEGITASRV